MFFNEITAKCIHLNAFIFCGGGAEDVSQMTRLNTFKMFIITKAARKKLHKHMQFKMRQKPAYIYFKSTLFRCTFNMR